MVHLHPVHGVLVGDGEGPWSGFYHMKSVLLALHLTVYSVQCKVYTGYFLLTTVQYLRCSFNSVHSRLCTAFTLNFTV